MRMTQTMLVLIGLLCIGTQAMTAAERRAAAARVARMVNANGTVTSEDIARIEKNMAKMTPQKKKKSREDFVVEEAQELLVQDRAFGIFKSLLETQPSFHTRLTHHKRYSNSKWFTGEFVLDKNRPGNNKFLADEDGEVDSLKELNNLVERVESAQNPTEAKCRIEEFMRHLMKNGYMSPKNMYPCFTATKKIIRARKARDDFLEAVSKQLVETRAFDEFLVQLKKTPNFMRRQKKLLEWAEGEWSEGRIGDRTFEAHRDVDSAAVLARWETDVKNVLNSARLSHDKAFEIGRFITYLFNNGYTKPETLKNLGCLKDSPGSPRSVVSVGSSSYMSIDHDQIDTN